MNNDIIQEDDKLDEWRDLEEAEDREWLVSEENNFINSFSE